MVENNGGKIISLFSGIAKVKGLDEIGLYEVLLDEKKQERGVVIGFNQNYAEVLLFDENFDPDQQLFRSHTSFSISVSDDHIGRIFDGLGRPVDGLGPAKGAQKTIFQDAPAIIDRKAVTVPLSTGIKIIDTTLPLGRGQRELIIGDRKLGKTTIASDIVVNQKNATPETICVYVLCGQKEDKINHLIQKFEQNNAFLYSIIVATPSFASFAQTFFAPMVGCAIAEYFRDKGEDVLIVYDDLSQHAKSYRDIALILERAPGRETYPGDIFSIHASLLERAGRVSETKGGGSLTALPIIETQEGDVTGFIPTNLISITDGQIYLENSLFQEGFLPAVNIGLSVSRIGSEAQPRLLKQVTGGLRIILSHYKELQKIAQMESSMSKQAQTNLQRGGFLLELFKQEKNTNISWPEQVVLFYAVQQGLFDTFKQSDWKNAKKFFSEFLMYRKRDIIQQIAKDAWNATLEKAIITTIEEFKEQFLLS